MRRPAKIILVLGIATVVAVIILLLLTWWGAEHIYRGKHLVHVNWLPAEASDVTYAEREGLGWFRCYECSLSKEGLDRMAKKEGWKLEPKSDVRIGLRRVLGLPALKETGEDLVAKALFYVNRGPNGGGITVIYDLDAGRLFVHESHF